MGIINISTFMFTKVAIEMVIRIMGKIKHEGNSLGFWKSMDYFFNLKQTFLTLCILTKV